MGAFVLKIGPIDSLSKWSAAEVGRGIAVEAGINVPIVRSQLIEGNMIVRVYDWIDGQPATELVEQPDAQARLGVDLGAAVAALHVTELDGFSSRLDESALTFSTWRSYIEARVDQIQQRAKANDAPEHGLRAEAVRAIVSLAADVSGECRPVVCHRDLHAANLLVDTDGSLIAVLDWDMPEAWDVAGEWFKLESFLFAQLPAAHEPFLDAYSAVHPFGSAWSERVRLVHLLENLNVVSNAPKIEPSFTAEAIAALRLLID